MWSLIAKVALKYLEEHPDQVAELIGQAVQAGTNAIKKHNSKAA